MKWLVPDYGLHLIGGHLPWTYDVNGVCISVCFLDFCVLVIVIYALIELIRHIAEYPIVISFNNQTPSSCRGCNRSYHCVWQTWWPCFEAIHVYHCHRTMLNTGITFQTLFALLILNILHIIDVRPDRLLTCRFGRSGAVSLLTYNWTSIYDFRVEWILSIKISISRTVAHLRLCSFAPFLVWLRLCWWIEITIGFI